MLYYILVEPTSVPYFHSNRDFVFLKIFKRNLVSEVVLASAIQTVLSKLLLLVPNAFSSVFVFPKTFFPNLRFGLYCLSQHVPEELDTRRRQSKIKLCEPNPIVIGIIELGKRIPLKRLEVPSPLNLITFNINMIVNLLMKALPTKVSHLLLRVTRFLNDCTE